MKRILFTIITTLFLLTGCNDTESNNSIETKEKQVQEKSIESATKNIIEDGKKALDSVVDTTKKEFNKVYEDNKENIDFVIEKTKEQSAKVMENAQESVKELQKVTENFTKEAGLVIEKTIKDSKEAFTQTINDKNLSEKPKNIDEKNKNELDQNLENIKTEEKENIKEKVGQNFDEILAKDVSKSNDNNFNKMTVDKYYAVKCASCHGKKAERKALNKSAIIGAWEPKEISHALHGYKNKTYGGTLKNSMYAYAKNLSDEEIEEISNYISEF